MNIIFPMLGEGSRFKKEGSDMDLGFLKKIILYF